MMRFAWPWMLAALPLPWLVYRLRRAIDSRGAAMFLPWVAALDPQRVGARPAGARGRWWFAAIWLLLLAAAARPQWLGEPLPVPTSGRRILLAVDVSGSMATRDMADDASRLQVVQAVAGQFIDGRQGDQVGLILFGTQPYVQAPLTADLATVHRFLDEAVVGVAGTETAIGDAIGLALKRLASTAEPAGGRTVLILLTDGQNDAGVMEPLQAADYAAQAGLRIYTIGVGSVAPRGVFGAPGGDDLDEQTLQTIARRTGGRYFRAADVDTLQAVYRQIETLEPAAGRDQWLRPAAEWFALPLALALLVSVPAAWFGSRTWH
jgi:Ca-activated chloride channel family protein